MLRLSYDETFVQGWLLPLARGVQGHSECFDESENDVNHMLWPLQSPDLNPDRTPTVVPWSEADFSPPSSKHQLREFLLGKKRCYPLQCNSRDELFWRVQRTSECWFFFQSVFQRNHLRNLAGGAIWWYSGRSLSTAQYRLAGHLEDVGVCLCAPFWAASIILLRWKFWLSLCVCVLAMAWLHFHLFWLWSKYSVASKVMMCHFHSFRDFG